MLSGCSCLALKLQATLRAADPVGAVQQELPADRALQAGTTEDRDQLLVERPMEDRKGHSERNTPVTLPRIWTWLA